MATKKKEEKKDETKEETKEETKTAEPVADAPVAMDEQLAVAEPAEIANRGGTTMVSHDKNAAPMPMGFDGFTEDDLVIPRYSIVQKAGNAMDKGHKLGHIMSNISEEDDETLRCIAVLYRKGMVLFEKPFQEGAKPLCRSNDALKPSADVENPPSKVCHEIKRRKLSPICEKAKWTKDEKTGKSIPPECNLCFNTIFIRCDNGMGFFMSFRSSGIAPWKNFITSRTAARENLFHVSMLLATEDKTNSFGTFKIPRFTEFQPLTSIEEDKMVEAYHGFQAMDLDASFDDERNQGDDSGEYNDKGDDSFEPSELSKEGDKF